MAMRLRPGSAPVAEAEQSASQRRSRGLKIAIVALGVVFGDLGTSPLYAMRECFAEAHGVGVEPLNVLGVVSLIFWALTLVVVVKYLTFVLRADNNGEGGILALLALLKPEGAVGAARPPRGGLKALMLFGLFGSALLYGDGVITPAISVLSAVEGLGVATSALDPVVVPVTLVLLVGIFLLQKRGTEGVGRIFGPTMLLWFGTITAMGLPWIARHPAILVAIDPRYALSFFARNEWHGFLVLGGVVLCLTGTEALYADMGHFGRRPIKRTWYGIVFPALLVNYFGQGALYLERGAAVHSPFFELVAGWLTYPVVAIATVATVIASQALISGAYSLTRQAIQLGYCPRMTVVHTSGLTEGQIYMPQVNGALMIACVALVIGFRSSSALAAAYGIAVTGTMVATTILYYAVVRTRKQLPSSLAVTFLVFFLVVDLSFLTANLTKIEAGGWFPIVVAVVVFTLMTTWKRGREALGAFMAQATLPLEQFIEDVHEHPIHRIPGTGVFMTSNPNGAPSVLLHHVKHNRVLHQNVVLLSVTALTVPEVPAADRVRMTNLGEGFFLVLGQYGFMESPNVPALLEQCHGSFPIGQQDVTYYLGRETLLVAGPSTLATWRKRLFALMSRNAQSATAFFNIPPNRVVELGTQVQL